VATLTCLLFGLVPALRASRADVGAVLKATSPSTTERRFGLRRVLVSVQVALSFVLLFGALLFARSLHNLTTLDPGFRTDLVAVTVDASALTLPPERRVPFVDELVARARAVPGVEAAAATLIVPLSGNGWNDRVTLDPADREHPHTVMFHRVTPGYFDTLGAPLLAGRDFGPGDTRAAPRVAVVTARFAQQLFPGEPSAVGRRFHVVGSPGVPDQAYEIVGVVADMKYRTLRESIEPTAFLPLAQADEPDAYTYLVVRGALPPSAITGALERAITDRDPRVVLEVDLVSQLVARSLVVERLMASLAAFFGVLAALLAVVGLYGVVSYSVARRVHEIGIRMALGADARRVARMIVGEAALLLGAGLAAGVALSLVAARAAGALLYDLAPHDPLTLALAVAVMTVVTLLAALVPARRAARTDPMVALRDE
jgi:predicted permease